MHEHEGLICKTAISGKIAKFKELGKTWHGPNLGQAQQQKGKNERRGIAGVAHPVGLGPVGGRGRPRRPAGPDAELRWAGKLTGPTRRWAFSSSIPPGSREAGGRRWWLDPATAVEPVNPRTLHRVGSHCHVFPGSVLFPS